MSINTRLTKFFSMLLVLGVIASGCKDKSDPGPYAVRLSETSALGSVLTDGTGRTLYYFANDYNGETACLQTCLATWPIFHHDESLAIHQDLATEDFAVITRIDGQKQTTYKGWPLYYFAVDGKQEDAGETQGQAVDGLWFAMKIYGIMYSNTQLIGADGNHYKFDLTHGDEITKYFTDDHGRTLYRWKHDTNNQNHFTAADYNNNTAFPIFYQDLSSISLSGALLKSDFTVITVGSENRKQLTYKGWPLYYFGQDTQRGDTKGVSIPAVGPLWPVVNASTTTAPN
jgi:predicted lipoprotein with Yx(FWY)xxD motif